MPERIVSASIRSSSKALRSDNDANGARMRRMLGVVANTPCMISATDRMSEGRIRQTVTERTFYAPMIDVIRRVGGEGVQETQFESYPDIVFKLDRRDWILSVKIGETLPQIKSAFLQYLRHKEESGIDHGLLVMLPDSIRRTRADSDSVVAALSEKRCTSFIDAGDVKEELRDRSFTNHLQQRRNAATTQMAKLNQLYHQFLQLRNAATTQSH